tara:strand:+ start:3288 stop:3431 length:144 start_codon:yes stop_codon:yes gene_type:complete
MKFTILGSGLRVSVNGKIITVKGGDFETKDKDLQAKLVKCKGVKKAK